MFWRRCSLLRFIFCSSLAKTSGLKGCLNLSRCRGTENRTGSLSTGVFVKEEILKFFQVSVDLSSVNLQKGGGQFTEVNFERSFWLGY